MTRRLLAPTRNQRGLTLVELLVAIVLMLMVTLGTVALYTVNSSSKRTIDASQTLDDTARFVFEFTWTASPLVPLAGGLAGRNVVCGSACHFGTP